MKSILPQIAIVRPMYFEEIRHIPKLRDFCLGAAHQQVGHIFYDSRLVPEGAGGTFFALKSDRADGHDFIPALQEKGIRQWVVSDSAWFSRLKKEGIHSVALAEDAAALLAEIAALHRRQFSIPVLAITGSNGKTIVKEWLSQLLEGRFSLCKNPKSYNSRIGVPISVWNLNQQHNLGLFEAGISKAGEMAVLEEIIRPDFGILTNLGTAHQEGFDSEEIKYREKLSLFRRAKKLILPEALKNKHHSLFQSALPETELLSWAWEKLGSGKYLLHFQEKAAEFSLPFQDNASLENLGNSIAAALFLGIKEDEISLALPGLNLPEMRLSRKAGRYGNILIDDSYTNDPNGLEAALQFAALQRRDGQDLILILSDLEGISAESGSGLDQLAQMLMVQNVSKLLTVGRQFADFECDLPGGKLHFHSLEDLMGEVSISDFNSCVILVKGSRRFGLERLVNAWQEKIHGTYLEINLDAMVHNLNFYKSSIPVGTGIMAMVKAFGYGSGDEEIARLLEFHRVDYLAVAYADEGIKLRESGIKLPIMVMNPTPDAMEAIFQYQLEPEIYSFRILDVFEEVQKSARFPNTPSVHLKVDTGMHRLGFLPEEVELLCQRLRETGLQASTVFSHLAAADDEALSDYSALQIQRFTDFCLKLNEAGITGFRRHILNSAGILRFPEAAFEMVRLGIGLYGIEANRLWQESLRPVSRLKTVVSQIKMVKAGESVGYGRAAFVHSDSKIATIAIGYSDGFRRAFSAGAVQLRWKDQRLPVVGRVCMDMCMVDITGTSVEEGDEITIFENAADVAELANAAGTIPYEILTGIGHRVKRVFYRE